MVITLSPLACMKRGMGRRPAFDGQIIHIAMLAADQGKVEDMTFNDR
jgi:hypothetical protein